jgi:hypothetical protein
MSDVADVTNDVDADEQAAFLAEMATQEVPDEESPEPTSEPVEESTTEEVEAVVEQEVETEEQPYTQAEIRAAFEQISSLQKALDKTNGTYGSRLAEQQKIIEELKQSRNTAPVTLTAEHFKELAEEYGDDMAEKLARSLNNANILQGGNGFDPSQLTSVVDQKLSAVEQRIIEKEKQLELRALNRQHRDWQQIASFDSSSGQIVWNNPQFGQFVSGLPEYEQQEVLNSTDADFLSEKITQFKDSIKPKAVKKQQIEAAVLPRGVGGKPVTNDVDDEEAAFRAEMARR